MARSRRYQQGMTITRFAVILPVSLSLSCAANAPQATTTVSERLDRPAEAIDPPRSTEPAADAAQTSEAAEVVQTEPGKALVWINGRRIHRAAFDKLLLESHGLAVLEQLIALQLVKDRAMRDGITVTEEEVQSEYDRSVDELARTVAHESDPARLKEIGEQVLQDFLSEKNFSLAEYRISVERNANLRKMVEADSSVSDADVREEFERRFGRKAVVRHIVLPDLDAVAAVRQQLESGVEFAELARSYSLHSISGSAGGLLPPFTRGDAQVPGLLREIAFGLEPGGLSSAVNIDGGYHLVRLERFVEADDDSLTPALENELRMALQSRRSRQAMQDLERQLLEKADIQIEEEVLRRQFMSKHRPDQPSNN
jgi:foldase protein PrsA